MVDWSLAQQPDIVGNALKYRAAGQQAAESAYDRNALMQKNQAAELEKTRIMTGRRDAIGAYQRGDRTGAVTTALGVDPTLAKAFLDLKEGEREEKLGKFKTAAALSTSLQSLPLEQRAAAKVNAAPQLKSLGWTDAEIEALGVDDAAIAGQIGLGMDADKIADNFRLSRPTPPNPGIGYRMKPDGTAEYIPGSQADPRTAGTLAGSKRAPPRPRAAGGGSRAGGLTDEQLLAIAGAR